MRVLTSDFAGAADPEVSVDGTRILFSGLKQSDSTWDIWEMDADGGGKKCLVSGFGDSTEPLYAGILNLLDDPMHEQIVFVSNAAGTLNESGAGPATALYACQLDGSGVRRLTYNLSSDWSPNLLPDGRVLFTSWQRNNGRHGPHGLLPLMTINTDGTDLMPFYGNHERPRMKTMARVSVDGHVYFIESGGARSPGGGLARVSLRRPLHSHEILSSAKQGVFSSPCPIPDGRLLVSHRSPERTNYGLYEFDTARRKPGSVILDSEEWHEVDAAPLTPRARPVGRSTVVDEKAESAVFYCLNVYRTDRPEVAAIPRGSIKAVRVIEGLPVAAGDPLDRPLPEPLEAPEGSSYRSAAPFGQRRILGYAPVEEDGSFHITVPANTALVLQLLDQNNRALAALNSWIWARPREKRGCIGCHEDRELTPPNVTVQAVRKPAVDLLLPPEKRRTVDFVHEIAPLIEKACLDSGCHAADGAGLDLTRKPPSGSTQSLAGVFGDPYAALLGRASRKKAPLVPGSALSSPLMEHLDGLRAKDGGFLDGQDYQTFVEWIDLGAQYDNRGGEGRTVAEVPSGGATP